MVLPIGVLSVGASVSGEMAQSLRDRMEGLEADFIFAAALKDLTERQVLAMASKPGEPSVFVRFDERPYDLSLGEVARLLTPKIRAMEDRGVQNILVLCTAPFHKILPRSRSVLYAYPILRGASQSVRADCLGVLIPSAAQQEQSREKWKDCADRLIIEDFNPAGADTELAKVAARLTAGGADALLFDCMGYTEHQYRIAATCFDGRLLHGRLIYYAAVKAMLGGF